MFLRLITVLPEPEKVFLDDCSSQRPSSWTPPPPSHRVALTSPPFYNPSIGFGLETKVRWNNQSCKTGGLRTGFWLHSSLPIKLLGTFRKTTPRTQPNIHLKRYFVMQDSYSPKLCFPPCMLIEGSNWLDHENHGLLLAVVAYIWLFVTLIRGTDCSFGPTTRM